MLVSPSTNAVFNKVKSCLSQGRYEEALEYIVQAEISKTIVEDEEIMLLYKIEGYIGTLHYKEAMELAQSIINKKLTLRNYSNIIQAHLFEIECLRNLQLFDDALKALKNLEGIFNKLSSLIKTSDSELFGKFLYLKGHVCQSMGKLPDSISNYQACLQNAQIRNDRFFQQKILVNLASAYWENAELEQAHKLCMQALAIKTTEESYLTISKCLNLMGLIAQDKNNITSALNFYNQSLTLKFKIGNRIEIAKTLHSIGYINNLLGLYKESLTALEECYKIFEELENYSEMSILQNDIGLVNLKQGNSLQALKNFKTALSLSLKVKNDYLSAKNYFSLSKIFLVKNDIESALDFAEKSLELRKNMKNESELGETLLQIGLIAFIQNKNENAIKFINDSYKHFKLSKNKLLIVKTELVKIICFDQVNKKEFIPEIMEEVKNTIEKIKNTELSLLYNLGEAILLKDSKRLPEKAMALKLFNEVGNHLIIDKYFNEYALFQELKLLLYEYQILSNPSTLEDIQTCVSTLLNFSESNNQFLLKIYLYRIQAKLSLVLESIDDAVAHLEEAFLFAQSNNITKTIPELQEEYEGLDKKISYWKAYIKKKKNGKEIEKIGLYELIDEILEEKLIFYV